MNVNNLPSLSETATLYLFWTPFGAPFIIFFFSPVSPSLKIVKLPYLDNDLTHFCLHFNDFFIFLVTHSRLFYLFSFFLTPTCCKIFFFLHLDFLCFTPFYQILPLIYPLTFKHLSVNRAKLFTQMRLSLTPPPRIQLSLSFPAGTGAN